jgi:hypothetical protein
MKIAMVALWIGEIPDYFWFHYETTKNIKGVDFIFFTNQSVQVDATNYKVVKITKEELESKLSTLLNTDCFIRSNKKFNDLKSCYGELFKDYIVGYDYYGYYDIDTLMGDFNKWVFPHLPEYDVISFADEKYHNRICGPLTIIRNDESINQLYKLKLDRFIDIWKNVEDNAFEEHELNQIFFENLKVKLLYGSSNCETDNGGKLTYECIWSGNKVFVNEEEKLLYHFYRKDKTKLQKIGNVISARYDKVLIDDFLWVVHFSENYESLLSHLIESVKKYSNRRCVFYSINYTPSILFKLQYESEQFIFRRIDIPKGKLDGKGRDFNIMCSKPMILLDAIDTFPNKKFVHIDTDIYLTTNADNIGIHFDNLEHYPLINSHIHDVVYLSGINPNEEWTSPLHILLEELGISEEIVKPRRKCNVIVFDERSKWFFKEQMEVFTKFINSDIPGILSIFDEDVANALLTKYQLLKSLPLIDIENSYDIDISKFTDKNHPFNWTDISPYVVLPKTKNDTLFFHGFKSDSEYDKIKEEYGNSVLECEEICITYKNNTILFEKNSFLDTKSIDEPVDFIVKNQSGVVVEKLSNQPLHGYWIFYISDVYLTDKYYHIEIIKSNSKQKIYNNILCTTRLM